MIEELDEQQHVVYSHTIQGNVTSQILSLKSNNLRLSVCYSAHTFTSRNIHIALRAIGTVCHRTRYCVSLSKCNTVSI